MVEYGGIPCIAGETHVDATEFEWTCDAFLKELSNAVSWRVSWRSMLLLILKVFQNFNRRWIGRGVGGSSEAVAAHGCGAGGGGDRGADGGAEDGASSFMRSHKLLNVLSRNASNLSIYCLVKPAIVVRMTGLYEDRR